MKNIKEELKKAIKAKEKRDEEFECDQHEEYQDNRGYYPIFEPTLIGSGTNDPF